ncbi:hypothetical protein [Klebsiella sp. T2]|uniref:hypothetical protein n=1 Tax=Klebsiella sp. T2 TaxID=3374544 RepID=UPI003D324B84
MVPTSKLMKMEMLLLALKGRLIVIKMKRNQPGKNYQPMKSQPFLVTQVTIS